MVKLNSKEHQTVRSEPKNNNYLKNKQKIRLVGVFMAFLLTLIIIPKGGFVPHQYSVGDIATRDIKTPRDLNVPDENLTEEKRTAAAEKVRPLYDFSPPAKGEISSKFISVLNHQNTNSEESGEADNQDGLSRQEKLKTFLSAEVKESDFEIIDSIEKSPELIDLLRETIDSAFSMRIVAYVDLFKSDHDKGVIVRNLISGEETLENSLTDVVGLKEAQRILRKRIQSIPGLNREQSSLLADLLQQGIRPTLTFNKSETEIRKEKARLAVGTIFHQVKKGEMIVREGARVTADQVKNIKVLTDIKNDARTWFYSIGLFLCILLLIDVGHRFARKNIQRYVIGLRDSIFLAVTMVSIFVLAKIMIVVSGALESAFPYIPTASYFYAIPFALGAMLVRTVLSAEISLFFSLLVSVLFAILFGNNLFIAIYALAGSLIASHSIARCKVRSTLYLAGLKISLVNVMVIFIIALLGGFPLGVDLLYRMAFGFLGGFGCAVIANGTIPLIESVFKYTTDLKLLELANMDSPVLRELMIQAPGTYHHSIVVGNMVEAAAKDIDANPLLARVAAYYHDIGKIKKPLYFIENIRNGENRHDKLAPSMSALILTSHVKDGIEIAHENRLGESIIDIIGQHHGTSLIKFFYDKAKNISDPDVENIDERAYRYPGPKPQSREAALIMLADANEAASRTLTNPTPARIRGMVQKIINNIFIDGQLDECDLTLKDLHEIARSFNQVLAGTFHQRVDYPEPVAKTNERDEGKDGRNDLDRRQTDGSSDKSEVDEEGNTEDLKRLGMS